MTFRKGQMLLWEGSNRQKKSIFSMQLHRHNVRTLHRLEEAKSWFQSLWEEPWSRFPPWIRPWRQPILLLQSHSDPSTYLDQHGGANSVIPPPRCRTSGTNVAVISAAKSPRPGPGGGARRLSPRRAGHHESDGSPDPRPTSPPPSPSRSSPVPLDPARSQSPCCGALSFPSPCTAPVFPSPRAPAPIRSCPLGSPTIGTICGGRAAVPGEMKRSAGSKRPSVIHLRWAGGADGSPRCLSSRLRRVRRRLRAASVAQWLPAPETTPVRRDRHGV